jgi:hypothetical protein
MLAPPYPDIPSSVLNMTAYKAHEGHAGGDFQPCAVSLDLTCISIILVCGPFPGRWARHVVTLHTRSGPIFRARGQVMIRPADIVEL